MGIKDFFSKRRAKKGKPVPVEPIKADTYNRVDGKVSGGVIQAGSVGRFDIKPVPLKQVKKLAYWDDDSHIFVQAGGDVQLAVTAQDVVQTQGLYESPSKSSGYDGYTQVPEQAYGSAPSYSAPSTSHYSSSSDSGSSSSSSSSSYSSDSGGGYSSGE